MTKVLAYHGVRESLAAKCSATRSRFKPVAVSLTCSSKCKERILVQPLIRSPALWHPVLGAGIAKDKVDRSMTACYVYRLSQMALLRR
jgi:hypothetical protein